MSSNPTVLHEYKTGFLLWLMLLFFVIGCMITSMSVGLPLLLRLEADASTAVSVGIAFVAGIGMPILGVLLWLLIPSITTTHDPARGVLRLEYRRPLGRSFKDYPVDDIADIKPVSAGEHTYSLAMFLTSGKTVRLELSGSSNTQPMLAAAARIKGAIGMGERRIVL